MPKLTIMRGASGSGKSTIARRIQERTGAAVVSRDDIRFALFGSYWGEGVDEDAVSDVERAALRSVLASGRDAVSDNTNLTQRFLTAIANIGHEHGATIEVLTAPAYLEECLERNAAREAAGERSVPEDVVRRQHAQSLKAYRVPDPVHLDPYVADLARPQAVVVDIDGTLAIMDREQRGPFDWHKVDLDDLRFGLANTLIALNRAGVHVLLLSGRDSKARALTEVWLEGFGVPHTYLWMRPEGDARPDTQVKRELFDEHVRRQYHVIGVYDDRPSVVRMWERAGLPVNHVAPFARDF